MAAIRICVLTSSDSRSRGEAEDTAGQALVELSQERGWEVVAHRICPDDKARLAAEMLIMADTAKADIIFTTGGTGLGPRDVTPEATLEVAPRLVPGIAEAIRAGSMAVTRRAMLSRALAAQRGSTLIINMPGSEKAVRESFGFVADQLEHAVEMMEGGGHDITSGGGAPE